jgi:hypothetical protein
MDAPGGPVCGCGKPSRHESGWCGENCGEANCHACGAALSYRGHCTECDACCGSPADVARQLSATVPLADLVAAQREAERATCEAMRLGDEVDNLRAALSAARADERAVVLGVIDTYRAGVKAAQLEALDIGHAEQVERLGQRILAVTDIRAALTAHWPAGGGEG